MVNFILPDFQDTRDTIADCVSSLRIAPGVQHERIVENSMIPIALLFKASEMACAAGSEEQAVFAYFLSLLHAQAGSVVKPLAPVSDADKASRSS